MSPAPMGEAGHHSQRLVLTGATGFIGRHLQHELCRRGYSVTALVRPQSSGSRHVLPGVHRRELALDDRAGLAAVLADADIVIHCAGSVRGRDPVDFAPANVDAVRHICAVALEHMATPRVLLISSLAASRAHLSDYAASKREGENVVQQLCSDRNWVILRPPAVYGPGDREMRPLLQSIRRGLAVIVGPCNQRLSLLYVGDLARAVATVVANFEVCSGNTFELDDGRDGGYGWADIIEQARGTMPVVQLRVPRALLHLLAATNLRLARILGYLPMLTPGKVRELSEASWLCNNQPLSTATGWRPQVLLGDGVSATFSSADN